MSNSRSAVSLSRRAWLGGALAVACSRATEAPSGASAEARAPTSSAKDPLLEAREPGPGIAVIELFTSQGCSSCPPADRVLQELTRAADPAVLTLSFHVDYWNYLGWTDPYSSPAHSARQRSYAARLSAGRVFTPQAIVNGRHSALGSARSELEDLIRMEKQVSPLARPRLQFREDSLRYQVAAQRGGLRISLLVLQDAARNPVPRGENSGEELSHVHVVRRLTERQLEGSGAGTTGEWKPDLTGLPPRSGLSAAALVSEPSGAIVGATQLSLA